jgi:hypothetical protein
VGEFLIVHAMNMKIADYSETNKELCARFMSKDPIQCNWARQAVLSVVANMKTKALLTLLALTWCALTPGILRAASTINSTNAFSWGANTGYLSWRPDPTNGVSIGAYICQGYVYGANVGWINMGSGNPANHIRYQNNSATDSGVNFTIDPNNSGHGLLRGLAYGANIGWINFEDTGNPYVVLSNGQFRGYAYSANVGWINLGDMNVFVQTDTIDPGVDTDGNGLPDAWEYTYFGHKGLDPNADSDGDGESNLSEYRSGTNPADPNSVVHSARQLNISTRLRVLTDNNVLIGGFIITGTDPKRVIIRGIGPSLTAFGVPGALANPVLELHDHTGATITVNDNWKEAPNASEVMNSGLAPGNDLEAAILQTLVPDAYTVVLRGVNGATGVGLVEAYDLASGVPSKLANISTRGFVDAGDNVMIGGFIIGAGLGNNGSGSERVMVRAIGPSLIPFGITNALKDPTLELHDGNGNTIAVNDNWKDSNEAAAMQASGLAPGNDLESAILKVLPTGAYTAIVRGKANGTGVGLVEAYNLQ